MKLRSFGWIQNPSSLQNLKKTVQVFDPTSPQYAALRDGLIQEQICYFPQVQQTLLEKLRHNEGSFTYLELVGSAVDKEGKATGKRKEQQAISLLQITILPQSVNTTGKRYTDNWTSDGFLRWAVSWNFVAHDREKDVFSITPLGLSFSQTTDGSPEEKALLQQAILAYPPAIQVLRVLLEAHRPVTKFHIGGQLGFVGENGFTSYEEEMMLGWLKSLPDPEDQKNLRTNVEGTSDKYARMIAGWLRQLDFVESHTEKLSTPQGDITGFPSYKITAQGQYALRQSEGASSHSQTPKYIQWEFLATKASNTHYLRTRRAYILKFLEKTTSFSVLLERLSEIGFHDDPAIILNDLRGLNTFGLRIEIDGNKVVLRDKLAPFDIPNLQLTETLVDQETEARKAYFLRQSILPAKYIELLEIAFDPKRNRDFEVVTAELFRKAYGLHSVVLGGGRRPDAIAFTDQFGIIIDTKAYAAGYGKNISQADEMLRYIGDNQQRDLERNANGWWTAFDPSIPPDAYYFLWVSGKFTGRFEEQLEYTASQSGISGAAIEVEELLWGADAILKGELSKDDLPAFFSNQKINFRHPPASK